MLHNPIIAEAFESDAEIFPAGKEAVFGSNALNGTGEAVHAPFGPAPEAFLHLPWIGLKILDPEMLQNQFFCFFISKMRKKKAWSNPPKAKSFKREAGGNFHYAF